MAVAGRRGSILVATKPIPRFRILSDLDRRIEKDAEFLLKRTQKEIRKIIREAPVDPLEATLFETARMARSLGISQERILELVSADIRDRAEQLDELRKSPGAPGLFDPNDPKVERDERRGLAKIAHRLREAYGGPLTPEGWMSDREEEMNLILSMVPFRMGRLAPTRAGARVLPPRFAQGREPERLVVPLVDEFHYASKATGRDMKAILLGQKKAERVVLARHPLAEGMEPVYTILDGLATFLLALWVGLPTVEADVWQLPDRAPSAPPVMEPTFEDMDSLGRLMAEKFRPHQYVLPPALEPVASLARDLPRRIFADAFAGRPGEEEINLRKEADLQNSTRTAIWMSIFNAARASGLSGEKAKDRADKSPEFRRSTSLWRVAQRKAVAAEVAGHQLRDKMRLEKAVALKISRELSLRVATEDVMDEFGLWLAARHGRLEEDDLDEPVPADLDPRDPHDDLPNHVSERRHPNLFSTDGSPRVFGFEAFEEPIEATEQTRPAHAVDVPGIHPVGPAPVEEPFLHVFVDEMAPQKADGGPQEAQEQGPILTVQVR